MTVVATVRAHAMRKLDLAAVRARGTGGSVHAVMNAATGMGASTTLFLLRYCHDFSPSAQNEPALDITV